MLDLNVHEVVYTKDNLRLDAAGFMPFWESRVVAGNLPHKCLRLLIWELNMT